jgi:hypothetical protein
MQTEKTGSGFTGGRGGFEYAAKINGMNIMLKFGFESIP